MSTFIQSDQEIRSTSVGKCAVHTCSNNVCVNICLLDASSLNYSPLNLGEEVCKVKCKLVHRKLLNNLFTYRRFQRYRLQLWPKGRKRWSKFCPCAHAHEYPNFIKDCRTWLKVRGLIRNKLHPFSTASCSFAKLLTAGLYTIILWQRQKANRGGFKPCELVGHIIGAPLPTHLVEEAMQCCKDHFSRPTLLFTYATVSKIKRPRTRADMGNFKCFLHVTPRLVKCI